jgi:hypothetical protein
MRHWSWIGNLIEIVPAFNDVEPHIVARRENLTTISASLKSPIIPAWADIAPRSKTLCVLEPVHLTCRIARCANGYVLLNELTHFLRPAAEDLQKPRISLRSGLAGYGDLGPPCNSRLLLSLIHFG